ncbi:hypothetical protein H312_02802 [Anncaliia algerae PRA339]|uniref:ISXO2-like transposase domain-containing protein n=1 Tax=Anncaliia algerae PRA339 TaxID=1288291 RepID=A0A059EYJ7_9MICR|nr:hypothetical protein H312_02802 [Anncaliia algerae PRA339]
MIPNKSKDIIVPIICKRVISGSTIHTDEHKTHSLLSKIGFVHNFICHKYSFINKKKWCAYSTY